MRYRTAVLIDPNERSARALRDALELAEVEVVGQAGYGLDALATAFKREPDLVLVRVGEPFARPGQILQRLREAFPDKPVLAYSGAADPALVRRAMAAGATDWLQQPVTPESLGAKLREAARVVERRAVMRRHGGLGLEGGKVITVLGAQGGVGKTTIAVNLAVAIAAIEAAPVVLVDTDAQFGDVALALDLKGVPTTADVAPRLPELDAATLQEYLADSGYGVSVLPAPCRPGFSSSLTPQQLAGLVGLLRQKYDYVVLDTNGAFDETLAAAVRLSHPSVLVTVPDRTGLNSAGLALRSLRDLLGDQPGRMHLVLNRLGMRNGVPIEDAAMALGREPGSVVPESKLMTRALQRGCPVYAWQPASPAARAIHELALRLTDREDAAPPPSRRREAPLRGLVPRLGWGFAR